MAKLLLEKMADERGVYVNVKSRGILANPEDGISRGTYAVLLDEGIDSSFHKARTLEEADLEEADLVLTMTASQALSLKARFPSHGQKIQTIGGEDLGDPFGGSLGLYEKTKEDLRGLLEDLLDKIEEGRL